MSSTADAKALDGNEIKQAKKAGRSTVDCGNCAPELAYAPAVSTGQGLLGARGQRAIEIPRKARFFDGRLHKDCDGRDAIRRNAQYFLRNGERRQRFTARFFSSRRNKEMEKYPRQNNKQESNK